MESTTTRLGFWSGIISAVMSILWFITFQLQDVIGAVPDWQNLNAYAEAFTPWHVLYIYPSLILAMTFIVLIASIHQRVPEEKKIWSLIGLAFAIIYAVMASSNYNIQAAAIVPSLEAGQLEGIEMFIPDNPLSVFNALANSYVYMALAMAFIGFVFQGTKLQQWIRWVLFAQIFTCIGQIGYSMFGMPVGIFIATSMVWVVGAPAVFILLAIWFKKTDGKTRILT